MSWYDTALLWASDQTTAKKTPWKRTQWLFSGHLWLVWLPPTLPLAPSQLGSKNWSCLNPPQPCAIAGQGKALFFVSWQVDLGLRLVALRSFQSASGGAPPLPSQRLTIKCLFPATFPACFVIPGKSASCGGRGKGTLPTSPSSAPELPRSPGSNFSGIISLHAPRSTLWGILDGYQAGTLHFAEISLIPKALPPMLGNYNTNPRTFSAFVGKKKPLAFASPWPQLPDCSWVCIQGSPGSSPAWIWPDAQCPV